MINKKEIWEKECIQLDKRWDEIRKIKDNIPWRKMDKPEQDGWVINIVLSEEVLRSPKGEKMAEVVALCNRPYRLSKHRGELVSKIRVNKTFDENQGLFMVRAWDGRMIYDGPHLQRLDKKDYDKLDAGQRKYFEKKERTHVIRWGGHTVTEVWYVIDSRMIPSHYLRLKVRKRMLTLIRDVDPELEREEAYIKDKLEDWWRERKGANSYRDRWNDPEDRPGTVRRHWKDALTHSVKGDIDEPQQYKKLKTK